MQFVLIAIIVALACFACGRKNETAAGSADGTQTIAPAAAQPAPTGTDAMTDTVDIEDSRSEAEGGTSTESSMRIPGKKPPRTDTTAAEKATKTTKSRPPGQTQ